MHVLPETNHPRRFSFYGRAHCPIAYLIVGIRSHRFDIDSEHCSFALIRLHTEDAIVIYLVICITTVYYAFITSFRQPQSLIDGLVEPPMIPSWVPWVGSGFDYFAHPLTFFKKHRYNFSLTESQNVEVMVEQHTEWICFQIQVLWQDDRGCLLSYCSFQFSQRQVWSI